MLLGRGRFVGGPVAVVIADDAYRAEDAAELVEVDWDPQPAVVNMDAATAAGAPRLHDRGNCLVDLLMFDDDRLPQIFAEAKDDGQRHLRTAPGSPPCRWRDAPAWPNGTTATTSWSCTSPPRSRTRSVRASRRPSACPSARSG